MMSTPLNLPYLDFHYLGSPPPPTNYLYVLTCGIGKNYLKWQIPFLLGRCTLSVATIINSKIMGINIIFEHQVMVSFE